MNVKPWIPDNSKQPSYVEVLVDQINSQLKAKAESIKHNLEVVVSIDPRFTTEVIDEAIKQFTLVGWETEQKGATKVFQFKWTKIAGQNIDSVQT